MNGIESEAKLGGRTERKCSFESITLNVETVGISLTLLPSRDLTFHTDHNKNRNSCRLVELMCSGVGALNCLNKQEIRVFERDPLTSETSESFCMLHRHLHLHSGLPLEFRRGAPSTVRLSCSSQQESQGQQH
jgi:hypothetical protein